MLVFFVWEAGDRGARDSFPTRRSSDLGGGEGAGDVVGAERRDDQLGREHRLRGRADGGAVHGDVALAGRRLVEGDRKSTRLNSSHRCISYAVFCLKKTNRDVVTLLSYQ